MKLLKLCFVLSAALLFSSYSFGCFGRKVFRSTDTRPSNKQSEPQPTQLSSKEIKKRIDLLNNALLKCFGDKGYLGDELALLEAQLAEAQLVEAHKKEKKEKGRDVMCTYSRDFFCAPWADLQENNL